MTLIIPDELRGKHDEGMERMNTGGNPRVLGRVLELKGLRKGGEEFPIELTLGSWDNDGKRYYSGIIRDITEKKKSEQIILNEKRKSDELLLNILPKQVADELKITGKATTKVFENVTVLFTDFMNFKSLGNSVAPLKLVEELNEIFCHFDDIMELFEIEKIETISEAYLAACGVPEKNEKHAIQCIEAAKQMYSYLEERNANSEIQWELRIGIHSGPVVGGVVGKRKYNYDIFGDAVNTAKLMEANGVIGKINISQTSYELVKDKYKCTSLGTLTIDNRESYSMYIIDYSKFEKLKCN